MDKEKAISALFSLRGQKQNEADALGIALDLLTTGYQSDETEIARRVAEEVAASSKLETPTEEPRIPVEE